jgi:hypothetical protein
MAARNAALVINDIQADAIESFARRTRNDLCLKQVEEVLILLEGVDDNLRFSDKVAEQLQVLNPEASRRLRSVPSLQSAAPGELERYISALEVDWDLEHRQEVLAKISHSGHKTVSIDPEQAYKHVRLVALRSGEILIEAGASSGFVYIPMEAGLRAAPLGGYKSAPVKPWIPLGVTGVIRGAPRNATVSADSPVQLLAIPKDVYLRFWHSTYTVQELDELLHAA